MQQSCSENQGNCDFHYHCQEGLRCISNSCPPSLGFDFNTDCCQKTNIGDEDFCSITYPCGVGEGDCDGNDECINDLVCGLDNCPNSLGASYEIDCCESKGKLKLMFSFNTLNLKCPPKHFYCIFVVSYFEFSKDSRHLYSSIKFMFSHKKDSCKMKYCQDGIKVYYQNEEHSVNFYGHYKIEPSIVIYDRPYFKNGGYGIWWSSGSWWIGDDFSQGSSYGYAYYKTDVFCPNQLINDNGWLLHFAIHGWQPAGDYVHMSCKYIPIFEVYSKFTNNLFNY